MRSRRSSDRLLHLEVGDAVAQQAADAIVALEHRDACGRPVQLLGRGQARRARADDRDRLAGARRGRRRLDPALLDRALDDRPLDRLDRDRVVVDAEHARVLARRRAEASGELGEVVGRVQARRSPPASGRGRRGRSSPGSGCRAGSPGGRTECRSPCSARPDRASTCGGSSLSTSRQSCRRSATGRRRLLAALRVSMNPVGLPHAVRPCAPHELGERRRPRPSAARRGLGRQHPLVLARHHLDELLAGVAPVRAAASTRGRCPSRWMCRVMSSRSSSLVRVLDRPRDRPARGCSASCEVAVVVEHVGDAAAHAGGEVAAGPAEHDDAPAGHVLAAVVADALDDGVGAAVAHGEALAGDAAEEGLAAGRAVERDVADDDVVLGHERRRPSAGRRRRGRPTGPCRRSRWRRPRASA